MIVKVRDDRGRELLFGATPQRVVSLVPSDTLSVYELGCGSVLVGRTDYCELPESVKTLPSVGGTKDARFEAVMDLAPDLVIANQEENTRALLEQVAQAGVRVFVAFPKRAADALAHLARLARIFRVERDVAVRELVRRGYQALRASESERATKRPLRVFCPIWMDPLMTVHSSTYISDVLAVSGGANVFADRERRYPLAADLGRARPVPEEDLAGRDVRYPRVTLDEVVERNPELVLLPSEPHPFTDIDAEVFRRLPIDAASRGAIVLTDGKDLSWYGSRTVDALPRVRALIDAHRLYS